jgi:hypothetical protein
MTNQTLPVDQAIIDTIIANTGPVTGKLIVDARVTYWVMIDDGSAFSPTETEVRVVPSRFDVHGYWDAVVAQLEDMRKHAHWLNDEVEQ